MYYAFDRRWLNSTVTVTLVALNIALYLASFFTGDLLHDTGVLDVDAVMHGEYRRLATAVFLHGGVYDIHGYWQQILRVHCTIVFWIGSTGQLCFLLPCAGAVQYLA